MSDSNGNLLTRTRAKLADGTAKNPLTVTVKSRNAGGFASRIEIRDHHLVSDQPHGFDGTDLGPKPSELLLAALAACQEVTWRIYAEAIGIEIETISIELCGTQDLRGFMGLDESVPAGFLSIEGNIQIESSGTPDQLKELQEQVDAHCPVLDDLVRALPVSLKLK